MAQGGRQALLVACVFRQEGAHRLCVDALSDRSLQAFPQPGATVEHAVQETGQVGCVPDVLVVHAWGQKVEGAQP